MALCTSTELDSILSQEGVTLHSDDTYPYDAESATHIADSIAQATVDIEMATWQHYLTSALEGTEWGKWRCATLAACYLCTRRGQSPPASLEAKCERIREELEAIAEGKKAVPNLAKIRRHIPAMSNIHISNRYRTARVRVVRVTSVGRNESTEPRHFDTSTEHGFLTIW